MTDGHVNETSVQLNADVHNAINDAVGTAYANTNKQLAEQLGKAFDDLKKLITPISGLME